MEKRISVLFVCLGNICRSPMAEGLFHYMTSEEEPEWKDRFQIESCGTGHWHVGEKPHPDTRSTLAAVGAERFIELKRARVLEDEDFQRFDYLFAMDRSNLSDLIERFEVLKPALVHPPKIALLRSYDPFEPGGDVPDPYYDSTDGFQRVFDILHRSLSGFLSELKRSTQPKS